MVFLRSLVLAFFLLPAIAADSQPAGLKSPDQFLGYTLGSRFTPHHLLVDYFRFVDQVSPKVKLIEYGRTSEMRPLVAAIITSEANMARLDDLRLNNLRRTGLEPGEVRREDVVFVHLSYSVHGNEAAGSESSMAVLYDLVSGSGQADQWLANAVVILDPCLNPDGYARFSQWSNSVTSSPPNPNPASREHQEGWPSGRSNHYHFDLNRDWAWLTQQESRARLAFYLQWMPQVHADIHEFTGQAPYYFPPAARPYHPALTPWQVEFQEKVGRNHARYFDAAGWGYFTRERYDMFYPSYGDTYPAYSGAIGMTYEQGGGGFANVAVERENGDTLTLADRIEHHHVASLSTVEVSAQHASDLVRAFEAYYRPGEEGAAGAPMQYVISKTDKPARLDALTAFLDKHRITYGQAASAKKGLRGFSYRHGSDVTFDIAAGDLVISTAQPRGVLVRVLFEPEPELEDSLTYDITAWSLPMAYGLDAYVTDAAISQAAWKPEGQIGAKDNASPYAYAIPWGSVAAARAVAGLVQRGVVARYALERFASAGVSYPAGTVLVLRADNRLVDDLHVVMRDVLAQEGLHADQLLSGFMDQGKDLGSYSYPLLRAPSVMTLAGPSVSPYNMGEIWHYFEQELAYPVDIVPVDDLDGVSLDAYNVIVLPEGYYSLSSSFSERLGDWVAGGGTLIALGSANQKLAGRAGFDLKYQRDSHTDSLRREEVAHYPDEFGSDDRQAISDDIPGAIFRTAQDATHPLSFGLGKPYFTLKTSPSAYARLPRGNAIWLDDAPAHYGFVGYRARQGIRNTLVAGRQAKGGGQVIYLIDNPLFRSFWYDGKVLFANALFF